MFGVLNNFSFLTRRSACLNISTRTVITNCLHDSDISLDTSIETSSNSIDTTNSTNKIANNESISTDYREINLTDDFNRRSSPSHNSFEDEVFKYLDIDKNKLKPHVL